METFIWIAIFLFFLFRWPLLVRFLGTVRMFLFDAVLWTIYAAYMLANPGHILWLGYLACGLGFLWAFQAARKYLKYSEIQRIENEKGNSDSSADDSGE